jgi:gag-polypeptide of LTR copia-type
MRPARNGFLRRSRKKFKKQLAVEYREWQELNGIALSEIYYSCSHSVQILIGENRVAAEVWKQLKSCYSVSGYAAVEQYVLVVQELSCASCKSLQDFISQLKTTKERLEALSVFLPQSFYVVNLLRGLGRPFQSWAREVRHMDLNNLDFDTLCSEAFRRTSRQSV